MENTYTEKTKADPKPKSDKPASEVLASVVVSGSPPNCVPTKQLNRIEVLGMTGRVTESAHNSEDLLFARWSQIASGYNNCFNVKIILFLHAKNRLAGVVFVSSEDCPAKSDTCEGSHCRLHRQNPQVFCFREKS